MTHDPDDWNTFRDLAHRAVDDLVDLWQRAAAGEGPAWRRPSEATRRALEDEPLPLEGQGAEAAYRDFLQHVLPHGTGNLHPRFFGWVMGGGTPLGALADFLASGLNANAGGLDQAATRVERRVVRWLDEALGFGAGAEGSGLLTSGASTANLVGLAVMRHSAFPQDAALREDATAGGAEREGPRLTVHGSRETHASVPRALELLGLGRSAFRTAPSHRDGSVDVDALAEFLASGMNANAGTVATGAFDDLEALADLAAEEGLWLHVDGAFGALAALSLATLPPQLRPRLAGIGRADSLAFDLHKWANLPYGVGCALVRDGRAHRRAFRLSDRGGTDRGGTEGASDRGPEASYLEPLDGGPAAPGAPNFAELGPELSRPFRALKVWMAIKAHGVRGLAREIERSVELARGLARRVEGHPRLKLGVPFDHDTGLNVVCFRYARPDLGPRLGLAAENRINRRILVGLQEDGVAVPSGLERHGRFCLRVALVNHRTREEDLELLVQEVVARGDRLAG